MNYIEKVLVIDSDPSVYVEIESAMDSKHFEILGTDNYEDALALISSGAVSKIVLGSDHGGKNLQQFVTRIGRETRGRKAAICHLTDSEQATITFPRAVSELTQFAISRKSEIHKLKEKFASLDLSSGLSQAPKVENLLDEVFHTLQEYTTEMSDSIRYASKIQKAVLHGESSLSRIAESFVLNIPRNIVSGDFFWYTVRFNRVIIAVADCTGHGVPGALLSIMGHNMLNTIVNEKNIFEPKDIIKQLNYRFQRIFENPGNDSPTMRDGMDVAIMAINTQNLTMDFAGARRPLFGIINGLPIKIKGDLYAVGVHTPLSAEFKQHRISFGHDDIFYLGSDGYADQFGGPSNKKIGSRQFEQALSDISHCTMSEQKSILLAEFNNWKQHNPQTDDVLVLGIKPGSLI